MSGLPNHNYEAFAEAAHWLRQHVCEHVVSPHEVTALTCPKCEWAAMVERQMSCAGNPDGGEITPFNATPHSWAAHMRADISALLECDTIVMFPGWPSSRGARLELTIAMELGFKVFFYNADGVEHLTEMSR